MAEICISCGNSLSIYLIRERGALSCCPERKAVPFDKLLEALELGKQLLLICEETAETFDHLDGDEDSVGWRGDGTPDPMTFGHMRGLRRALEQMGLLNRIHPEEDGLRGEC